MALALETCLCVFAEANTSHLNTSNNKITTRKMKMKQRIYKKYKNFSFFRRCRTNLVFSPLSPPTSQIPHPIFLKSDILSIPTFYTSVKHLP